MSKLPKALPRDEAETLAIKALQFLASDPARLGRFLALTGIGPAELKASAGEPHLLAAVLDHLMRDESLLLVFAAEYRISPELIALAHRNLTDQT
jgi:hypothetical protein